MEVTVRDIAKELDLSAATVSRSLRNDALINPKTRARVNEAAHRMGYKEGRLRQPRRSVKRDTSDDTGIRTLGLLLRHNSLDEVRHDVNLTKMMAGIMTVADASRALLQVHTIRHDETRHMAEDPSAVPPMIQQGDCQAFIVRGDLNEKDVAFLARRAPVVSMGRVYRSLPVDAVVGDNVEGMQELVAHLVEFGHRRLAWVGVGYTATFMSARKAGFIQGCLEHDLEVGPGFFFGAELYGTPPSRDEGALQRAFDAGITGFVCGNDYIAYRVIKVLEEAGWRIPEDVSVTGFDAMDLSGRPHLTSVDPHFFEIGQAAAQLALQRIGQSGTHPCVLSVRGDVVAGNSTGPAPDASPA